MSDRPRVTRIVDKILPSLVPTTVRPHNIFVFGQMGHGKTSFLNTCLIAFGETSRVIPTFGEATQKALTSVTLNYNRYQLTKTNIFLFDTYGWELNPKSNYSIRDFASYMRGFVRLGANRPATAGNNVEETSVANDNLAVSSVVFLVASEFCQDAAEFKKYWDGDDKVVGLKTFYEEARNLKKRTQFVISQLDLVLPEVRDMNYDKIIVYPKFKNLKASIQCLLPKDDEITDVWPLVSYTADELKTTPNLPLNDLCAAQIIRSTIKEDDLPPIIEWNIERLSDKERITGVGGYQPKAPSNPKFPVASKETNW